MMLDRHHDDHLRGGVDDRWTRRGLAGGSIRVVGVLLGPGGWLLDEMIGFMTNISFICIYCPLYDS